ncbi:MAG TPA: phenylalanine--tRNA ligase subunit beta [Parcubacteria group bacterium]|nr:phenylalanine--tRNA ligase subunit beta [Parcubacteria group bacterium]
MKVSYKWLQEYIEDKLPEPKVVADALTMHSFEIEEIVEKDGDSIIDVKILPNRAHDCLSHYGIASEICSVLNLKRKDLLTEENIPITDKISLNISTKNCSRQIFILVNDVKVNESPEWLKEKLASQGSRSINAIVDMTNYLTFAFGQPMHAFDAGKVSVNKKGQYEFNIRDANNGEKITLLDGKVYEIDSTNMVIADGTKALDVAGVMGGKDSGVTNDTKNIILSLSCFDPVSIRKTAKKLGIRTDASHRFENEISESLINRVLPYVLKYITELSSGVIVGMVEVNNNQRKETKVSVSLDKVSSMLGLSVSSEECISLLERQNIKSVLSGDSIVVTVPPERLDVKISEDVVEEIGRLFGYKNISPAPLILDAKLIINSDVYIGDAVRKVLGGLGFIEIYTYAFSNKGEVLLENPLALDKSYLRSNLALGMEESLERNFKYLDLLGIDEVRLFEIGKVFKNKGEYLHLSLGVKFPKSKKINVDEEIAKTIQTLEESLNISVGDVSIVGGVAEFDLERVKKELNPIFEYPLGLWDTSNKQIKYNPISAYPFAVRDVAVFVPNEVSREVVESLIKEKFTDYVVRFSMFDKFTKENRTSYAFRLVFQANDRTLTEDEINAVMSPVYETLKAQAGFEIR